MPCSSIGPIVHGPIERQGMNHLNNSHLYMGSVCFGPFLCPPTQRQHK